MQSPSLKAQSSAIRTVAMPKGLEKPWTQVPLESRRRPPAPAWPLMMEASVFSLYQPGGGLSHLALSRGLALGTLDEAVRK
nr:hypothetical protein CFP56_37391 [Quercus suber]